MLDVPVKRFRRFRGYDHSRGAVVFVSFHVESRLPLFGRVANGKMVYSPVGEIAVAVIEKESCRTPGSRQTGWYGINDAIDEIAVASGGVGVYVKRVGGRIAWQWKRAEKELT